MPTASCSICFEDLLSLPPQHSKSINEKVQQQVECHQIKEEASTAGKSSVSATPCGHVFHTGCVLQWIQQRKHCPQCRRPVVGSSALTKLFLAEDQATLRRSHQEEQVWFDTSVTDDDSLLKQAREDRDESRVIQDVLTCQLEDLECEVRKLREHLSLTEDQLQDKVQEVSGLESDLLVARRRELELERRCANTVESLQRLGGDEAEGTKCRLGHLERDNAELRNRLLGLREERELDLVEMGQKLNEMVARMAQAEAEVQAKSVVITELQAQLNGGGNIETNSIYESVEDDEEDQRYSRRRRTRKRTGLNFCSCIKSAFAIVCLLAVILGLLVVLPLKLIFAANDQRN